VNLSFKSLTLAATLLIAISQAAIFAVEEPIERANARALYEKSQSGAKLTGEEQAYLDRARAEMRNANAKPDAPRNPAAALPGEVRQEQSTTGLKPSKGSGYTPMQEDPGGRCSGPN
jgi:hypothetical protein